jgi:hypothetical protein
MKAFFKSCTAALLAAGLLCQGVAFAADNPGNSAAWSAVTALKPGDGVFVQSAKEKVAGKLETVSANSISLKAGSGIKRFDISEVRQVRYVSPRNRLYQKVGLGFGLALLGFTAADLALTAREAANPGTHETVGIGLLPVIGSAAGTIVCMFKGRGRKIYGER